MRHTVTQSMNFLKLVRKLRPLVHAELVRTETIAIGVLEKLCHTAIEHAPSGNIGRLEDAAIAEAIGWGHEPSLLISILLDCGWLERCNRDRIRIADWPKVAEGMTRANPRRPDLLTSQWRRKRMEILERDDWTCRYCGKVMESNRNATVDHVIPYELAKSIDDANLVAACRSCNSRKGNR